MIIVQILLVVLIIAVGINFYYRKKNYEQIRNKYLKEKSDELNQVVEQQKEQKRQEIEQLENRKRAEERSVIEQQEAVKRITEQLRLRRREAEEQSEELIKKQKEVIDKTIEGYYQTEKEKTESKLKLKAQEDKIKFNEEVIEYKKNCDERKLKIEEELNSARAILDDHRKKIEVINEAILRQRAIDEQQDFYKVQLSENAINDVEILKNIRTKLMNPENLDKLIYDAYIAKPVLEMVKRVLEGEAPSGIYKITRLKTGEIYIGKSTDVKSRWQQHCKTAYNVGNIAHSILHTTIQKDGLSNFTFELVEKVPKDKLSEREKYWIDFYDTKRYGLNEKAGG